MADFRFVFLFWVGLPLVAQAQAELRLSAEQDSIGLGEPLTFELQSDETLSGGIRWAWPSLSKGDTLPQGWEVLSVGPIDSAASPNLEAGLRRTQRIEVMAWDTGYKVLEPLHMLNGQGDTTSSLPLLIQVGLVSIGQNPAPQPMQGFKPYEWTWWERLLQAWPWLAAILAAIGLAAFLRRLRGIRKPSQAEEAPLEMQDPGHLLALRMLKELEQQKPWLQGREKETQAILSEALRLHLDSAFGVKSLERTTTELVRQLHHSTISGLDAKNTAWLSDVLQRSDLVKFAKHSLSSDAHHRAVSDALKWVENTQPLDGAPQLDGAESPHSNV